MAEIFAGINLLCNFSINDSCICEQLAYFSTVQMWNKTGGHWKKIHDVKTKKKHSLITFLNSSPPFRLRNFFFGFPSIYFHKTNF